MECQKCNKKQATFFLSRDESGGAVKVGFCDTCAEEIGLFSALQKVESVMDGYGLFSSLGPGRLHANVPVEFAEECRVCGTSLEDFQRDFRLGCDQCCHIFGSLLYNYVSLITPGGNGSNLEPLYPGLPPAGAQAKRRRTGIHKLIRQEIKKEKSGEKSESGQATVKVASPRSVNAFVRRANLNTAPDAVWLQTRIEHRRNFSDVLFPSMLRDSHRRAIEQFACEVLQNNGAECRIVDFNEIPALVRVAAGKRHFDRQLTRNCSLLFNRKNKRLVLVNEEDHLAFVYCGEQSDAGKALEEARRDIEAFESKADLAYSPRFGYLTSSPRDMGAAVFVSVLMHLPFSLTGGHVQLYPAQAERAGVRFEPYCGQSLERHGFFRVSSLTPFNATEQQVVEKVFEFAHYLQEQENKYRTNLKQMDENRLKNLMSKVMHHCLRSYRLSYQDVLRFTSFLAAGASIEALELRDFSPARVVAEMTSPFIMYSDRRRYTINECEKRRADLFADLVEEWTNPLLAHPVKNKASKV